MTKKQMAIDIATQLFMKPVSEVNWKVKDLMKKSQPELKGLHSMALRAAISEVSADYEKGMANAHVHPLFSKILSVARIGTFKS